jgi:hypothetical protein
MFGHDQSQHQQAADEAHDGVLTNDDVMAAAANDTGTDEYEEASLPAPAVTPSAPVTADPVVAVAPVVATTAPATVAPVIAPGADALLELKQQALQQLTPLVGHLEQSPEEKFRTTMMMIQAADNADLIKVAYDAALQIPDEKVRAQALLDIVNEINYFTHSNETGAEA